MKLYDSSGALIVVDDSKEISRGGEGRVIQIENNQVAKLYLPGIPVIPEQKFQFLNAIQSNAFIKPLTLLKDQKGKPCGFTMIMIPADYFPLHSTFHMNFCDRHNIDYSLKLRMFEKIIDSVKYVHSIKIVVGDLNPMNILVNDLASLFFIDVDSYQTPGFIHSGRLFDDIRDYLYNGQINEQSDFFALAVMAFSALTNVHPFKGVHKKITGMSERMIHKIPVFDNDKDLIVPKCYKPIQDKHLQEQFFQIFKKGDRFLLNLNRNIVVAVPTPIKPVAKTIKDLIVNKVLDNRNIKDIVASDSCVCIIIDDECLVYDASLKGFLTLKTRFQVNKKDKVFVNKNNVFLLKDNYFYSVNTIDNSIEKFENLFINEVILSVNQFESVISIITSEKLYTIYLEGNTSLKNFIKHDISNVFGRSFKKLNGLNQSIDGKSYLRYNFKNTLNIVPFPEYLKDVYQIKDIGIAQYIYKNKIHSCLFKIDGLSVKMDSKNLDTFRYIGYKDKNFIAVPEDDKLVLIRPTDFSEIASFECDFITEMSQVFVTDAGIIIREGKDLYLLNKK